MSQFFEGDINTPIYGADRGVYTDPASGLEYPMYNMAGMTGDAYYRQPPVNVVSTAPAVQVQPQSTVVAASAPAAATGSAGAVRQISGPPAYYYNTYPYGVSGWETDGRGGVEPLTAFPSVNPLVVRRGFNSMVAPFIPALSAPIDPAMVATFDSLVRAMAAGRAGGRVAGGTANTTKPDKTDTTNYLYDDDSGDTRRPQLNHLRPLYDDDSGDTIRPNTAESQSMRGDPFERVGNLPSPDQILGNWPLTEEPPQPPTNPDLLRYNPTSNFMDRRTINYAPQERLDILLRSGAISPERYIEETRRRYLPWWQGNVTIPKIEYRPPYMETLDPVGPIAPVNVPQQQPRPQYIPDTLAQAMPRQAVLPTIART